MPITESMTGEPIKPPLVEKKESLASVPPSTTMSKCPTPRMPSRFHLQLSFIRPTVGIANGIGDSGSGPQRTQPSGRVGKVEARKKHRDQHGRMVLGKVCMGALGAVEAVRGGAGLGNVLGRVRNRVWNVCISAGGSRGEEVHEVGNRGRRGRSQDVAG